MLIFQLKLTSFVSDILNPYVFPAIIQPATPNCSRSSQLIKTTGIQKMWTNGQLMTSHHSLSTHYLIQEQTMYRISLIMYITMGSKKRLDSVSN